MGFTTTASLGGAAAVHRDFIRIRRALRAKSPDGPLSAGQMSALWTISQHAPIRATELADREGVTGPTVSRVIACLERYGMVTRTTDPHDGRVSLLTPTDAGIGYIEGASSRSSELFEVALRRLDGPERDTVRRSIRLLADTMCELTPAEPDNSHGDDTTTEGGA